MKTFEYTALDKKNAFLKGKLEAKNSKQAIVQLEKKGLLIVNIQQEKITRFNRLNNFFTSVKRIDIIFFTRHLHTLLEAGISLDQAVKISAEHTTNLKFKAVLFDIYKRIQKGQSFHYCLNQHKKYFSNFYINLIKIGEKSGKLDDILIYLLKQQESEYALITKTRTALIYPIVVVTALIVMVVFMMIFVVPKISAILLEYKVSLPLPTRIIIGISAFLVHYGLILLPVLIVIGYLVKRWTITKRGKWQWDSLLLKTPVLNSLVTKYNLARFSRSLATLLYSGVSIDQALELVVGITNNSHYQKSFKNGIPFVRRGVSLTEVLKAKPNLFPPIAVRMVEVGEKSGKLDRMLSRLAKFYEESLATTITNLMLLMEPTLLIVVGLTVAFVALSILTPIWKYTETI